MIILIMTLRQIYFVLKRRILHLIDLYNTFRQAEPENNEPTIADQVRQVRRSNRIRKPVDRLQL